MSIEYHPESLMLQHKLHFKQDIYSPQSSNLRLSISASPCCSKSSCKMKNRELVGVLTSASPELGHEPSTEKNHGRHTRNSEIGLKVKHS